MSYNTDSEIDTKNDETVKKQEDKDSDITIRDRQSQEEMVKATYRLARVTFIMALFTLVAAVCTGFSAFWTATMATETKRMADETANLATETRRMADETANLVVETAKTADVNTRMLDTNLVQTKLQYVKSQLEDYKKSKFQYLTDEMVRLINEYPPNEYSEDYCVKLTKQGDHLFPLCGIYYWCKYYIYMIDSNYCNAVQALGRKDFPQADKLLNESSGHLVILNTKYAEAMDIIYNRQPVIPAPPTP